MGIVTNNGVQFTCAVFAAFLKERNIFHHRSSLYSPAANGAVERFNLVLKHTILMAIQQHQPRKSAVTDFLQVYRATPHAATGTSTFQLLYGRQMRTKLSVLPSASFPSTPDMTVPCRVMWLQHKMKQYTDTKRGAHTPCFQEGDKVLVRNPLHIPKGHRKFTDPLTVTKRLEVDSYILSDGKTFTFTLHLFT